MPLKREDSPIFKTILVLTILIYGIFLRPTPAEPAAEHRHNRYFSQRVEGEANGAARKTPVLRHPLCFFFD